MMARLVKRKSITVTGVSKGLHISLYTSDRVWISGWSNNIILTNTEGEELHRVTDIVSGFGVHTVTSDGDLIYIDREYNINKLSTENKVKSTLIKYTAPWEPRSVYSSPSTGDLLVGMENTDTKTAKVNRYSNTGEHKQTIKHNNTGQRLYSRPKYITENHNGDVIVSDYWGGVVVTDRGGRHRFSYTGPPSGSRLYPRGICTDSLSHILVCDDSTSTVQMMDKDGHFLSQIKTPQGIDEPLGLSYDEKTNLLWVGGWDNNTVNIYRYIYGDSLTRLPKCQDHPRDTLEHFCVPCEVPLCQECSSSDNHTGHDCRDVRKTLEQIHKKLDRDAVLMCLLLCQVYKINLKEEDWIKKYNAVAKIFNLKMITKESSLANLEKYSPILKHERSEVMFSHEFLRHASFLRFSEDPKFVEVFLTWAEKENIAEYCRSWLYPKKEDEVFFWLLPEQTVQLIEKLGDDVFTHPTMEDQSIHDLVFSKVGIPMQIIMRGDKSIKNFIENLRKGRMMMYNASGMIVGCAGSGKSTLLGRLKGIDLGEIKENTKSTRGIDIQSDVFDVSNTIKVNSSVQKQHFKIAFDESSQLHNVPESPVEVTDDLKMQQSFAEKMEGKDIDSEAVNVEQMSEGNMNLETNLSKRMKATTLSEKTAEQVVDSQNVAEDSEISGFLRVTKSVSDDQEKKITMVDFAGQCAYYASHQIFLSPRAFFILVINMEKKFDDKVGEEVCSQEGSIFRGWTYRDYLTFWMKSIHQYSSNEAPVVVIGTHAEEKTEQEKTMFFREVWKTLETKDKSLQKHLHIKRRFAVGFHDSESIEQIKLAVVDVVQELDHWGEELPRSWVMFENFFQEKKSQRIMNKETLLAFNEALPQEIKLQTIEDINVMLQFFHDIREILYFDQESLNEVIILDVQWFADAFKNVITDKNHAEEDLFEYASEWDKFNETGELNDTLLSAIWKINNNGYIEHKNEIMPYMEKLGLLADMGEQNKKWYVPCMNKIPFPGSSFTEYPASSIICFIFDVLPAGIFQRLVATCMQIPWEVFTDEDRGCIYQTAAIFMFPDLYHHILIGMTQTEIQLQVFVIEGDINVSMCHQIRERIERELNKLSSTFQKNSEFHVAFKCKPAGFCDGRKSTVINESNFAKATFPCPSCPASKKHIINTKEMTKYWKQEKEEKNADKDGKVHSPRDSNVNMEKIRKLLQVGTEAVRICFDKFFSKGKLEKTLKDYETDMRKGHFRFLPPQLEILFPSQGGSNTAVSSLSMDVTIMYKLLRNYSDIVPPGSGWGKEPKIVHISESDDIERIRLYRNKYAHDSGGHHDMKDDVFNIIWTDLSQAIMRLSGGVLKRKISEI